MDATTSDRIDEIDLLRLQAARLRVTVAQRELDVLCLQLLNKYSPGSESIQVSDDGAIKRPSTAPAEP